MVDFPLHSDHFGGGANLTPEDGQDLVDILNSIDATNRLAHKPMVTPSRASSLPTLGPEPVALGSNLIVLSFTLQNDKAYRIFKIPSDYIGDASFHAHWTKTDDVDEQGHSVRWKVEYTVFNGIDEDGAGSPTIIYLDDTYEDARDDSTRIVYTTPYADAPGFVAKQYVSAAISAVTPVGIPLTSEPALFSLDLVYRMTINKGE